MMDVYYTAIVKWIKREYGGRISPPPQGTRYCPLIKLNDEMGNPYWSIDFICTELDNETMLIAFKFVSDKAPVYLLSANEIYGIYEGNKKVAELILKRPN